MRCWANDGAYGLDARDVHMCRRQIGVEAFARCLVQAPVINPLYEKKTGRLGRRALKITDVIPLIHSVGRKTLQIDEVQDRRPEDVLADMNRFERLPDWDDHVRFVYPVDRLWVLPEGVKVDNPTDLVKEEMGDMENIFQLMCGSDSESEDDSEADEPEREPFSGDDLYMFLSDNRDRDITTDTEAVVESVIDSADAANAAVTEPEPQVDAPATDEIDDEEPVAEREAAMF